MSSNSLHSSGFAAQIERTFSPGPDRLTVRQSDQVALLLRLGLGSVFVVGGWWKLQRAIDAGRASELVEKYTASNGYINDFFQSYLFRGDWLSAWGFLTALSAFELVAGIALVAGLLVRPLAIVFGLLMWSFVAALPVSTVPGHDTSASTFFTPAMIVQIRDIGLSGMCFTLAVLGSGSMSLDERLTGRGAGAQTADWSALGLLLRLSVAIAFLAGGFFYGLDHVKSWSGFPLLLILVGLTLASGHGVRIAAVAAFLILVIYCAGKISLDKTLWDNLNAIKREFAFLAASLVLVRYAGGAGFRVSDLLSAPREVFFGKLRN
ncbi:DoxX family protein [uncultured Roseibium sp.]|uniref:DoxX family protein n=1 Tax=uncultured Roseibium sp. TaxID=1936171 RepID=UPI0026337C3E|nr:DoxX family protein [uncultured Roseibium sp.]